MIKSPVYAMMPEYIEHLEKIGENGVTVIPLFPAILACQQLNIDSDEIRKLKLLDMKPTGVESSNGCFSSKSLSVLEDHPEFKQYFLDAFETFNTKIFGHKKQFTISTSWLTRVDNNGESQFHNHRNSFYSGIYYFDSLDKDEGGWLQIINQGIAQPDLYVGPIREEEITIYNTDSYGIKSERNLFVLFPSHLMHRVTRYLGKTSRYSLAMNFVPVPPFGSGDSAIPNW